MTIEPRFLEPDMGLGQVLAMMEVPGRQIYVAPVLQLPDRKVLGILRMHDILSNG
jgi:hypothetical protein